MIAWLLSLTLILNPFAAFSKAGALGSPLSLNDHVRLVAEMIAQSANYEEFIATIKPYLKHDEIAGLKKLMDEYRIQKTDPLPKVRVVGNALVHGPARVEFLSLDTLKVGTHVLSIKGKSVDVAIRELVARLRGKASLFSLVFGKAYAVEGGFAGLAAAVGVVAAIGIAAIVALLAALGLSAWAIVAIFRRGKVECHEGKYQVLVEADYIGNKWIPLGDEFVKKALGRANTCTETKPEEKQKLQKAWAAVLEQQEKVIRSGGGSAHGAP